MAGCYHNQEEFESDLTIEVAREGDILKEGQALDEIECDKNPGHRDFIPFKDLTLEHLPNRYRNTETLDYLKQKGSRVVRLVVDKIKNGRLIGEVGSGFVFKKNNQYRIRTNNHVVKTEDEVKHCIVEFHYDDDNRSSVITSRGVKQDWTCPYRDITHFTFHPVPDFLNQLEYGDSYIDIMLRNNQIKSVLAMPTPSESFLTRFNLNRSDIYLMFISYPDGSIGYLKSSYFKFQPIPSNIQDFGVQELTSVEVHIDEDDGKSRVIPGEVVKLGDDFVVIIPESIYQDKVKKCRIVCNGQVIGRGTRLYFNQCKFKDVYKISGIDEDKFNNHLDDMCEFNFHPKNKREKTILSNIVSNDVCCIGHPHGATKQITFGQELGESLEKFDNQFRHITRQGSDCQCTEVNCLKYSCKTCRESPVFRLCDLDVNLYYTHFMAESVNRVINGEQIENINRAWRLGLEKR